MKLIMSCIHCGAKFEIEVNLADGYITFDDDRRRAKVNILTDGHSTLDFYCGDCDG